MKTAVINAVKEWNEKTERNYDKWILAEDLKVKHRAKIIQGFGKHIPVEEWVAVYDNSFMDGGKKGIIFTADKLYLYEEDPILLSNIAAAYELNTKYHILRMTDGTYVPYQSKSGVEKAIPVLQCLLGIVQGEQHPTEGYQELHTTYRRELRRRMNDVTKKTCEKSDRFISVETADPEFVDNALARWEEIDRNKILAFLVTTRSNGKEAIVITEEAVYSGTGEMIRIPLDGLVHFAEIDGIIKYTIYENYFAEHRYFYIYGSDKEIFYELINRYISIYQMLQKEILEGNVEKSGLDLSDGLNKYLQKKEDIIDTYKNSVFVSSTFRDMHFERDIIHEKVQPALSAIADQYGERISFCDLRWGVNTENLDSEEGAKKVLIVCLDEIEKCDPYMLIMLGERYGWIPSDRTILNALESRPDFKLEELEKSVTALEIEFGALAKQTDKDRIFVYFREMDNVPSDIYTSEDIYHAEKLAKLKERVRRLAPDRVKTYRLSWDFEHEKMNGINEFAQMIIEDIGQTMEKVWTQKEKLTAFEQERQLQVSYMRQKAGLCYAREDLLASCLHVLEDGIHLLALTGVSGCGKSTVMGALSSVLMECQVNVLPMFCGLTKGTETALNLVQHMCYYLENLLNQPHFENEQKDISEDTWLAHFKELIHTYSKEKETPIVFMVDAIDQLAADNVRDSLKFIPDNVDTIGSKVYMVISCLDDFELAAVPAKLEVPMLKEQLKSQVIQGILKRNRRELDRVVIQNIVNKPGSDSPLYLSLLIQRLLMMNKNDFDDIMADGDGMSAITKHQLEIVKNCGESISSICKELIDVSAERIGGDFVKYAIDFISLSKHGLRESDLEGLLMASGVSWNRLEFSLFMNYLRNIFVLREDGCYDFSHKIFRQEFMVESAHTKEIHGKIFQWLEQLPENDMLKNRELLEHCIDARDSKSFIHYAAKWMKDQKNTKDLNRKMLTVCRIDKGMWLREIVKLIENDLMSGEELQFFLKYVTEEIGRAFHHSPLDLEIREALYADLLPVAEYLVKTEGGVENERRVSIVYSRLGRVYELSEKYEKADIYLKKALEISEHIIQKYEDEKSSVDLSVDYRLLANLYLKYGDNAHEELAVNYFQKSVQLAESAHEKYPTIYAKRMLSASYKRMGDYYSNNKLSDQALEYYLKCMEVRKAIVNEEFTVDRADSLADVLELIAYEYREDNMVKSARYYEELIACREQIVQNERTISNMLDLSWAYNDAGYIYYLLETVDYRQRALECFEKCIPVFEDTVKNKENMTMLWHLADDYRYCMNILHQLGGIDNQKRMEQYASRSSELYEYRARKLDNYDGYLSWDLMLDDYVKITGNQSEKCKSLEKRIMINEKLYEFSKDKARKKLVTVLKLQLSVEKGVKKL